MGLIVLDTVVLIDNLRDAPGAGDALDRAVAEEHSLMASTLTRVGVMGGMRSQERRATYKLMDSIDWVDVDEDISEIAGRFAREFRRSHQGVGVVDYVIAATAEHLGAELWTRNLKHFPMFPDLEPPY